MQQTNAAAQMLTKDTEHIWLWEKRDRFIYTKQRQKKSGHLYSYTALYYNTDCLKAALQW